MRFYNGRIFVDGKFINGGFEIENGRFSHVGENIKTGDVDLKEKTVLPGLIDIHIHGAMGADFCDGDYEGLLKMSEYLGKNGITSFAPTSLTVPYEDISKAIATAVEHQNKKPKDHSRVMGINMEGPYVSMKKKGSQNGAYIKDPDIEGFKKFFDESEGLIRLIDLAPESAGACEFTKEAAKLTRVSIAHTDADYEEAKAMITAGASHVTHLFNGMPSIHHRMPGVIGAASECDNVTAELICDGMHVHESAVRMAFKLFPGRICLISDALRCLGMPDGDYDLGGNPVTLKGNVARLKDSDTLAGSATNLFFCMKHAMEFGIDVCTAIKAATETPAYVIGQSDNIGSIAEGKLADFIICDSEFNLMEVYIGGEAVAR